MVVVGCVIVMACVGTASVAAYLGIRYGQIDRVSDIDLQGTEAGEPANFLLVGTDSREGIDPSDPDAGYFLGDTGCECTDTIMVLRVDPEKKQAYVLSFPRDLYIPISGTGETQRINTAHAHGVQTLIDTIQDNFNIPINHYVEVDFQGFEKLVDAVGGVPMWFDAPVRDSHTGLDVPAAECQVLNGEQARQFVRSRHLEYLDEDGEWQSDPTADLGRITRQQVFVRRSIAKAVSQGLTNPITLNELVSAGVANVRLDEAIDAGDLISLGSAFAEFDSDDLAGFSIPTESMRTSAGAQVELPLMREAANSLAVFRGLPPGTIMPESVDVTVLNGSGVTGQAADAAGALGRARLQRGRRRLGPRRRATSRAPPCAMATGTSRRRPLASSPATSRAAPPSSTTRRMGDSDGVVVITGSDFTTIHDQPAPEGSPDDERTTTSTVATEGSEPSGDGTTTTVPETTTTTVIGYSTGEPPDGVDCG